MCRELGHFPVVPMESCVSCSRSSSILSPFPSSAALVTLIVLCEVIKKTTAFSVRGVKIRSSSVSAVTALFHSKTNLILGVFSSTAI